MTEEPRSDLTHSLIPHLPTPKFGHSSVSFHCPFCSHDSNTEVSLQAGSRSWVACSGMCVLGCWFGCCLLPFCMESMQEPKHFCQHCKREVNFGKRALG